MCMGFEIHVFSFHTCQLARLSETSLAGQPLLVRVCLTIIVLLILAYLSVPIFRGTNFKMAESDIQRNSRILSFCQSGSQKAKAKPMKMSIKRKKRVEFMPENYPLFLYTCM